MRKKIPIQIAAQILFLNRRTCCFCRENGKHVQIHHIDENNGNNRLDNLAILCLDCHSQVTGNSGLGKKFSSLEITKYKNEWEKIVKKQFGYSKARERKIPKIEKELFTFEIKKLIYEMVATTDNNRRLLVNNFEILLYIAIFEDLHVQVIDLLQIPMTVISDSSTNKPILLAEYLPKFFDYLLGPKEFDIDKKDEKAIREAIKALDYIHVFSLEENKKYAILKAIKNSVEEFIEISVEYNNNVIFRDCIKLLRNLQGSARTIYYKNDKKLPRLSAEIDKTFAICKKELRNRKLKWVI